METLFIRLLHDEDKSSALAEKVLAVREGRSDENVFPVPHASFQQVPNTPFCYWVSERIRRLFTELPPFESEGRTVKQGLATADDFRFVRTWWEVPAERLLDAANGPDWQKDLKAFQDWCRKRTFEGKRWVPFAKGGEYSPYYADIHLVVDWELDGEDLKVFSGSVIRNPNYQFRPGLTWSLRTDKGSVRTKYAGTIHGHAGHSAFFDDKNMLSYLAWFNSDIVANKLMRLLTTNKWEVGYVQKLPVPNIGADISAILTDIAIKNWNLCFHKKVNSQISLNFLCPAYVRNYNTNDSKFQNFHAQFTSEEIVLKIYSLTCHDIEITENDASYFKEIDLSDEETDEHHEEDEIEANLSVYAESVDFLQWCLGVVLGRWDVRFTKGERQPPELPDPFDPLPVCPPGMLQGLDGLPAKPEDVPPEYPVQIDWDGILVDDPEHGDDIVRRMRDVLEVIWKDQAEAIEKEACEILGVRELRDYFRKSGNGGFWMDHVKRYSKSRRKAPIYWYLRSAKGNYGLWLYYHRLDKDILFKALLNYVEPKIRLEEDRLNTLRNRKEALGSSGREVKQIEKDIDHIEQFVSELYDFKDKLRRAANLNLTPDLNDGVVLNIAPLWELVPWKEAKRYWEELMEGGYDWSHIAYQLWPDRVKEVCKKDRSIAIAHGLEDIYEVEPSNSKKAKKS